VEFGLEDYERRVEPATAPLRQMYSRFVRELDQTNGAYVWWTGHSDWKTLTMLADYLLQSLLGASEALVAASFAALEHKQMMYAENAAVRAVWKQLAQSGKTNALQFAEAMPRDGQARRRGLKITQSAEMCFFHLMQTLDRVAAAVIIVGGFQVDDVTDVYWTTLESLTQELASEKTKGGLAKGRVEPVGSAGRDAQTALVIPVVDSAKFGEHDWLPWMRHTRNAMTHRSPAKKLNVLADNQLVWPFYKQPKWSELQSLVFGIGVQGKRLLDAYILKTSVEVVEGLCVSTTKLVTALTETMTVCWDARRSNPAMIIQQGRQWPTVQPTKMMLNFPGYGKALDVKGDTIVTNDADGLRWTATRLTDDRRQDWYKP
jgi:hypothetical protein